MAGNRDPDASNLVEAGDDGAHCTGSAECRRLLRRGKYAEVRLAMLAGFHEEAEAAQRLVIPDGASVDGTDPLVVTVIARDYPASEETRC